MELILTYSGAFVFFYVSGVLVKLNMLYIHCRTQYWQLSTVQKALWWRSVGQVVYMVSKWLQVIF